MEINNENIKFSHSYRTTKYGIYQGIAWRVLNYAKFRELIIMRQLEKWSVSNDRNNCISCKMYSRGYYGVVDHSLLWLRWSLGWVRVKYCFWKICRNNKYAYLPSTTPSLTISVWGVFRIPVALTVGIQLWLEVTKQSSIIIPPTETLQL